MFKQTKGISVLLKVLFLNYFSCKKGKLCCNLNISYSLIRLLMPNILENIVYKDVIVFCYFALLFIPPFSSQSALAL